MTPIAPVVSRHVLSSGLRVVAIEMPAVRTAVVEFISEAGSRYDAEGHPGISHFLEHMLYRGTPNHPGPHELALAFERKGGLLEAATYIDHGSVVLSIPPINLNAALGSFCEVLRSPILEGMDVERAIVREEILENLDENGRLVAPDDIGRLLSFGDHSLGHPITGTLEALERFDEKALRAHHDSLYVGAGSVICVAGAFDRETILTSLSKHLDGLPKGKRLEIVTPRPSIGPKYEFVKYADSQSHLRIIFRAPGNLDPREPAVELLLRLLDDGMSTRLYHRICNTLGLCYDVSACYESWSDVGVVEFAGDCAHEQVAALGTELFEIIVRLRDDGPTDEELTAAKERVVWQHNELLDDPAELTGFYGYAELKGVTCDPVLRAQELSRVSMAELMGVAKELFAPANMTVVCVGEPKKRVRDLLERQILGFV